MRTRLYGLDLDLSAGTVTLYRHGIVLLTVCGVMSMRCEHRYVAGDRQHMSLLRINGQQERLFFIDEVDGSTNVREVLAALSHLDAVLSWLLPTGHMYRQGDIGIYRRERLPRAAEPVPASSQPQEFAPVLGLRHVFKADANCSYFRLGDACFVQVHSPTPLIHPEHETVLLIEGVYELIKAHGESLCTPLTAHERKLELLPL